MTWMAEAACLDVNVDDFFPDPSDRHTALRAKTICAGCPVRLLCLEYAQRVEKEHGIFGGYTAKERAKIRRLTA